MKQNDFQVQYDVSRWFGVRAGFVWSNYIIQPGSTQQVAFGDIYYPNNPNRGNCVGLPLNPDGSCTFSGVIAPFGNPTTEINNYSGVVGAWFRKGMIIPAMAIAGSLVEKKSVPPSAGTFPTTGGLFVGLVVGVILIVGGLTFFPALALGPIVEQLAMTAGTVF